MNIRPQLVRTVVAWIALGVFMVLLQPTSLPVVVLIVPFILLFVALYNLWILLSLARSRYIARAAAAQPHKQLGVMVCLCAVLLLVLQSLGQLTLRDAVTVAAILVIGYIYVRRSRFSLPKR
jgi:hypothetical protein